jgi:MerR family copper efflux transcriptional regulator
VELDMPKTDLVPIEDVARRLGLRASAIRYYEERGLVAPAERRSRRRWYDDAGIRRLAVIQFWQSNALMSLEDIGRLIDSDDPGAWPELARTQVRALETQIARLRSAQAVLDHVLEEHPEVGPDGCPHFEHLLFKEGHRHDHPFAAEESY